MAVSFPVVNRYAFQPRLYISRNGFFYLRSIEISWSHHCNSRSVAYAFLWQGIFMRHMSCLTGIQGFHLFHTLVFRQYSRSFYCNDNKIVVICQTMTSEHLFLATFVLTHLHDAQIAFTKLAFFVSSFILTVVAH